MSLESIPQPSVRLNYQWTAALKKRDEQFLNEQQEIWSFNTDFSCGVQGDVVEMLFYALFPTVSNRAKKGQRQAFSTALLMLAQACLFGDDDRCYGFLHALSNSRKKTPKRYAVCDFSGTVFKTVLIALSDNDFIQCKEGFRGKGAAHGLTTLWLPGEEFKFWLDDNLNGVTVERHLKETPESVQLKNADKVLIDYVDDNHTLAMRQRIEEGNQKRASVNWSYLPLVDEQSFALDDVRRSIPDESLRCYRVFREDFRSGGRFYCGAQGLRKAERGTITVNGQPTIELDYKSLHPRLVYNSEGLEAPVDCYASESRPREMTKFISLLCINCESLKQALSALMRRKSMVSDEAKRHLEAYVEEHKAIEHRFFALGWKQLQYLDSQLVDLVLTKAVDDDIPVLPVHDSFIVSTKHAFWLKEQVEGAYQKLMGFEAVVDWEPMPDMSEYLSEA